MSEKTVCERERQEKSAAALSAALIVVVIGVAPGAALWAAAHDDGLVIESFSVPPGMADRGLSGEAVAASLCLTPAEKAQRARVSYG